MSLVKIRPSQGWMETQESAKPHPLTFLKPTTGNNASVHFGALPILGVVGKP
jgi:hypothetical protein